MSTRRQLKAAEAVREVVGMAILVDLRDPRVSDVTVTRVEMDADMRGAKVLVSVMGSPTKQALALRGLASAAGFLQSKIADRIETRYTPRLRFELDAGVKQALEIARMLREVLPLEKPIESQDIVADESQQTLTVPDDDDDDDKDDDDKDDDDKDDDDKDYDDKDDDDKDDDDKDDDESES